MCGQNRSSTKVVIMKCFYLLQICDVFFKQTIKKNWITKTQALLKDLSTDSWSK